MKYNGINVPDSISPRYIISAFANPIDYSKVDEYTEAMQEEYDIEYTFPPITGYPGIITDDTIDQYAQFINGEDITENDIGELAWFVTDGHHRSIAANNVGKKFVDVELDRSTITDIDELEEFDKFYNL